MTLNLVAQGLGVALLPTMGIDLVPEGVTLWDLEPPIERVILAAVPPAGLRLPAVRAFLGAVRVCYPESAVPPLARPEPEAAVEQGRAAAS